HRKWPGTGVAHVARNARKARFEHQDTQARAVDGLASMGEPRAAEIIAHQVAPTKVIEVAKKCDEPATSVACHCRRGQAPRIMAGASSRQPCWRLRAHGWLLRPTAIQKKTRVCG